MDLSVTKEKKKLQLSCIVVSSKIKVLYKVLYCPG